jgi:curved DNA-binding protein CbpA
MNLNIETYGLDDILNLFQIPTDFDDRDLKSAKKIVLMVHPDKSGLSPDYFRFYSSAYKILYFIWDFKNKNSVKITQPVYSIDKDVHLSSDKMSSSEKHILNRFLKNEKMKDPKVFNSWFNEQFEKVNIASDDVERGYGDWFKSNDDINTIDDCSLSNLGVEMEKRKSMARALAVRKDYSYNCSAHVGISDLSGDVPDSYSSGLFSTLQYDDLHKAYTETVVPVTNEDYANVQKFKNVDEYQKHRHSQNVVPLSTEDSMKYLNDQNATDDRDTTRRGYKLAKQTEELAHNQKSFFGRLMNIDVN